LHSFPLFLTIDLVESLPDKIKKELKTKTWNTSWSLTETMESTDVTDYLKMCDEKIAAVQGQRILQGPFIAGG
jgi:hypothetical protein